MVSFEIFSDPICPWCFIGKTWFDRALEACPDQDFEIIWKPFQLNPDMPISGMERTKYLDQKFGDRQQALTAYKPIVEVSIHHKIGINFEDIKRTPNTLDAHRLIHWARIEGVQNRIVTALFKAYFKEGKDIGDKNILTDISKASGLKPKLINRLLGSEHDKKVIKELDLYARKSGITGVPLFIVDGTYVISGAQKPEFWKNVFKEIKQNQQLVT
jgi:predicted DsbA family dithiol-disulfide isomerase